MTNTNFTANEIPLHELISNYKYDPDTGEIMKVTGTSYKRIGFVDSRGYLTISHNGVSLKAHRVAYALYYGEWPSNELDHINRRPLDNRISNLRLADRFINNQNREFKPKWSIARKWEIFNSLLAGENPSNIIDLEEYFPYSFKTVDAIPNV